MSEGGEGAAPLRGIRVLECGGTVAGAYAGRLLADLGAEVITAQPEGGDRVWRRGAAIDGSGLGAVGAYLHAGKRPAVGAALWTFRLKSGGRIQVPSYQEYSDAYVVTLGGTSVRIPKVDVDQVVKESPQDK